MISRSRFWQSVFMAWLVFLMLDFLAHASLLKSLWARDLPALKSQEELFRLIPLGYLSFGLLTILIAWLYVRLYPSQGDAKQGIKYGAGFGFLFACANFLGWYSFLNLPLDLVAFASFGYFVEICAVGFVLGYLIHAVSIKKRVVFLLITVVLGLVVAIVLQNLI